MNKIKDSLLNIYNSLNNTQKLILAIIIVVCFSLFYLLVVKNSYREDEINYNTLNFSTIIEESDIVYDRSIIKSFDEVLNNILKINYDSYYVNNKKITFKKVYENMIYNSYTKELSYGNFKKKIKALYNNVLGESNINILDNNNFINKVYYSSELDMYIISVSHINDDANSFIGLKVFKDENIFKIAYLQE